MKGFNIGSIAKIGKMGLAAMNRNLPSILTGAAIAGLVATVWTTYKAAPNIKSAIDGAKWDKAEKMSKDQENVDDVTDTKLNAWETFTAVAPYVWKPAVCGTFTVGCIVGAQILNVQRLGVLSLAYKMSETKLKEYEDKAKEILGEDKARDLHDAVAKETAAQVPLDEKFIVHTGKGKQPFIDTVTGQTFYSSKEAVLEAANYINNRVACCDNMTVNDFYCRLGLEEIKYGDAFFWDVTSDKNRSLKLVITMEERIINEEPQAVYILDYAVNVDPSCFR